MGLRDLFKSTDYAQEFKEAFEKTDISKCISVAQKWQKNGGLGDANCSYATIILSTIPDDIDHDKLKFLFKSAETETAENNGLRDWYKVTARLAMAMKVIDVS